MDVMRLVSTLFAPLWKRREVTDSDSELFEPHIVEWFEQAAREEDLFNEIVRLYEELEILREVVLDATDKADGRLDDEPPYYCEAGEEVWGAYTEWFMRQRRILFARLCPQKRVYLILREVKILLAQVRMLRCESDGRETLGSLFEELREFALIGRAHGLEHVSLDKLVDTLRLGVCELTYQAHLCDRKLFGQR